MSDIVEQSREAREKLATALSILQAPEAENLIDSVAGHVARAMGALHQIESSGGEKLSPQASNARSAVRDALAALQGAGDSKPAEQAMAHVAGSLGLVHGLAEKAESAPTKQDSLAASKSKTDKPKSDHSKQSQRSSEPSPEMARTQLASDPAPAAPSGGLDQTLPTPTKSPSLAPPASLDATQASVRAQAPKASEAPAPRPAKEKKSTPPRQPARSSKHASAPPEGKPDDALAVEANLGAHSPTNFYKGLSGNDVIDDGGLFVATYDIPNIGTKLWVLVNMPGGYDFHAVAEVRWTRESDAGDPGFGCAFKSVSKEARQLVYRYVKNREPLFHDDL